MQFLSLILVDADHAPIWVYVLLGAVIGIVSLILYFATYTGEEHDHWYGDPTRHYYLTSSVSPEASWGAFGGFGVFRGGL